VPIVHLSPYVADIGRYNSTTEPQGCGLSARLLSILSIGGSFFQLIIGCWIRKSTFLQYSGMHGEYHLQGIEEKRATSILSGAFSANDEYSLYLESASRTDDEQRSTDRGPRRRMRQRSTTFRKRGCCEIKSQSRTSSLRFVCAEAACCHALRGLRFVAGAFRGFD
jgi:hypothetical protein